MNIDITEPLSGSLVISYQGRSMKVPLIYEGLHEVCALCGSDSHQIEVCPDLPTQSKIEIVVEKFGETNMKADANSGNSSSSKEPMTAADQWIRVSPKKRFRSMITSSSGKQSTLKPPSQPKVIIVEPSLSTEDKALSKPHSPV